MRLKQRVGDFRVRELLARDTVQERGPYRVYRVTKRKLTSDEAARELAREAGVEASQVGLAGLKDRQGITIQYMTVAGGREVRLEQPDLKVETVGFAERALSSADSEGNAFELTVRALRREEVARLRANMPLVREHGTINYFDDQRFGNLTHGQGWLYRDLCLGRHEGALRDLLGAPSPRDDERHRRFKEGLSRHWGDWRACRDVAGRFGAHHSIFEHLNREPHDFAGAFAHVATRLKLIHLYAWQSYLWNRAVAELVRETVPMAERVLTEGVDGPLVGFAGPVPAALIARRDFPLPGERLEGVAEADRKYFLGVLGREGLTPEAMAVTGIPGFALKPEPRELLLVPRHLRVRPAEPDSLNHGFQALRVRFELPRGGYATLVVKRLFSAPLGDREDRGEGAEAPRSDEPRRPFHAGGPARDDRGGRRDSGGERRGAHRPWRDDDAPRADRPPQRWRAEGDRPRGGGRQGGARPWGGKPWHGGPPRSDDERKSWGGREGGQRREERDDRRGRDDDRGRPFERGRRPERERPFQRDRGGDRGRSFHRGGESDRGRPFDRDRGRDERGGDRRGGGRPYGGQGFQRGGGGSGRPGGRPWNERSGGGGSWRGRDDDRRGPGAGRRGGHEDRRGGGEGPGRREPRGPWRGGPAGPGGGRGRFRDRRDEQRPPRAQERPESGPEWSEE